MGSTGRVVTKPSVDGAYHADSVLFIGTNFEFPMFNPEARFIDVNLRRAVLGDRHPAYLGIVADAPTFLRQLLAEVKTRKEAGINLSSAHQGWYDALVADRAEWDAWIARNAERSDESPARFESIYKAINEVADDSAIFGIDVGNVNIATARFLNVGQERQFVTSPLYAPMGFGMPAGLAAGLDLPRT